MARASSTRRCRPKLRVANSVVPEAGLDFPDAFAAAPALAEEGYGLPIGLGIVAGEQVQQCALAAAIGAGDKAVLAPFEVPVQIAEDAEVAEGNGDAVEGNGGSVSGHRRGA